MIRAIERMIYRHEIEEVEGLYESIQEYMLLALDNGFILKDQEYLGGTEDEEPLFELHDDELAILNSKGLFLGSVSFKQGPNDYIVTSNDESVDQEKGETMTKFDKMIKVYFECENSTEAAHIEHMIVCYSDDDIAGDIVKRVKALYDRECQEQMRDDHGRITCMWADNGDVAFEWGGAKDSRGSIIDSICDMWGYAPINVVLMDVDRTSDGTCIKASFKVCKAINDATWMHFTTDFNTLQRV